MLNLSFGNKFTSDLGSNIRLSDPNLKHLLIEISSSNQICLWKYEQRYSGKYRKKPYHYSKSNSQLIAGINEHTRCHLLS